MSKDYPCVYHKEGGYCSKFEEPGYTSWCVYGPCSHQERSRGDIIRTMSDEELAKWALQFVVDCTEKTLDEECCFEEGAEEALIKWLQESAEGEESDA